MEKIKILADSTCDLSDELTMENDISLIPFYVTLGEERYRDRETLTTSKLYQYVDEHGELPKTSAPTPEDYRRFFQQYVEEGYQIIYIYVFLLIFPLDTRMPVLRPESLLKAR